MKNLLLLLLLCFSSILYGQTDFRKGKIIKLNGDTVSGELGYRGDIRNAKSIRFINKDIDTTYRPFKIKGYFFEGGKSYISKTAFRVKDTVQIFAEYLVNGKKDLFFNRSGSGFHYLISVSDTALKEIPFKIETVRIDGVNYQKEANLHKGYLKTYFNDCPSLFPKIEQLEIPERKSLISLAKEYNEITCGEGSCIIYDRKEYPVKFAIEPAYCIFLKNLLVDDTVLTAYGGHVYLWLPNSSERLFIKSGLYFSHLSNNYLQIPLQFEYVYPFKVVIPKFNFGVNMQIVRENGELSAATLTTVAGGGCYIRLAESVFFDCEISSDVVSFNWDPEYFLSFVLKTGLLIKIST